MLAAVHLLVRQFDRVFRRCTLRFTRTSCVTWLRTGGRAENRCEKFLVENGSVTTTVVIDRALVAPLTGTVVVLLETPSNVEVSVLGLLANPELLLLVLHLCAWETVTRTSDVVTGVRTVSSSIFSNFKLLDVELLWLLCEWLLLKHTSEQLRHETMAVTVEVTVDARTLRPQMRTSLRLSML